MFGPPDFPLVSVSFPADYVCSAVTAWLWLLGGTRGSPVSYVTSGNGEGVAQPQLLGQVTSPGERLLLGTQLAAWYICCPSSLIVSVIYWSVLVRHVGKDPISRSSSKC